MKEIIKPIFNYDGYFISNLGKVYCNIGKGGKNTNRKELYEIKPRLTKNGYGRVYMRNKETNKRKDLYIHRLVAEYFIPNPENKRYVNHKDCNRMNNSESNLEWCTAKENNKQTEVLNHIIRDEKGLFVSNFKYEI